MGWGYVFGTCSAELKREAMESHQNVCQLEEEPQAQEQPNAPAPPVLQRDRGKERSCGHDCEFVHPPPDCLQTECSVCLLVLRSPNITSCCGHNFCKECIERVQKDGKDCPLCNREKFTLTYNRAYDVSLRQFEVYCTHRKIGCEWKGKLEMLDKHLNVDPELEKQLEGCAFVELQCCHDGCKQSFQRRLIAKHQSRECPQRPFTCEHCHEYESTYHDVTTTHWPMCRCYPVSCPHKCTSSVIERQNLEQHLNKECPLQEVECEFKYAGCETKLPRKDMPEHLKENVGHMLLLARQNRELMVKLLEKEEQIRRMTEENRREIDKIMDRSARIEAAAVQLFVTKREHRSLEIQARGMEQRLDATTVSIDRLYHHVHIATVQLTMPNFRKHRRTNGGWDSEGFYTHPQGYKMCLGVYALGRANGRGTHVSYFLYLMPGEFDIHLKWPFRGSITVQLLNQLEDNGHHSDVTPFDDKTPSENCEQVTRGERSDKGWGEACFIPHSELGYNLATNCQYLVNDCLYFRVKAEAY